MTTRDTLLALRAYPVEKYDSIDLNRLTVFVISQLVDMDVPTSIENIAVASFMLFPTKFQMYDYPEFPDMTRTNRALMQLRPKYRGWADGSTTRGFVLNAAGEIIAKDTLAKLETDIRITAERVAGASRKPELTTIDREALLADIRQSACYAKFTNDAQPRGIDFLDMVNAYSHTPSKELRRALRRIETIAADEDDDRLIQFVKWCRQNFSTYLIDPEKEKKKR